MAGHCSARVHARVEQGFEQGSNPGFLRLCKGCKAHAHACLTYMCAQARLRMCDRLHITFATLATLALKSLHWRISAIPFPLCPQGFLIARKG